MESHAAIVSLATADPDRWIAVAIHDLVTGRELLVNPDRTFHPASTVKVAVMMAALRQFRLEEHLSVTNEFLSIADGSSFSTTAADDSDQTLYEKIGQTVAVRELVRLMIVRSSNLATNVLLNHVAPSVVTGLCAELGAAGMQVRRGMDDTAAYDKSLNNQATARSLMVLLARLARRTVITEELDDVMIEILLAQEFSEGIPAGLPPGTPVAHKTGWIDGIYHDAGIVYPPEKHPYVVVVMTEGFSKLTDAQARVAEISALAFRWAV